MSVEHSFGIVPLRKINDDWHVLLVQLKAGHWGFPKGHADLGETSLEAAKRELFEETSLKIKTLLFSDPFVEQYTYTRNGKLQQKTVSYYLAEVEGEENFQTEEVADAKWLPLRNAEEALTFKELKNLVSQILQKMQLGKTGEA